jgi:hypothetical protein
VKVGKVAHPLCCLYESLLSRTKGTTEEKLVEVDDFLANLG